MNKELKLVVDRIVSGFAPDKIILFGSRARGDFNDDSDYDLLVLKKNVKHRRKAWGKIVKSLRGTCFPADIIVQTPNRYDELKKNWSLVYSDIDEQGKVLYEK